MLAIVIAGLVRSSQNRSVHYSQPQTVKVKSLHLTKVCVQNVLHVLECKLEDVDATALSLHR